MVAAVAGSVLHQASDGSKQEQEGSVIPSSAPHIHDAVFGRWPQL